MSDAGDLFDDFEQEFGSVPNDMQASATSQSIENMAMGLSLPPGPHPDAWAGAKDLFPSTSQHQTNDDHDEDQDSNPPSSPGPLATPARFNFSAPLSTPSGFRSAGFPAFVRNVARANNLSDQGTAELEKLVAVRSSLSLFYPKVMLIFPRPIRLKNALQSCSDPCCGLRRGRRVRDGSSLRISRCASISFLSHCRTLTNSNACRTTLGTSRVHSFSLGRCPIIAAMLRFRFL